MFNQVLLIGNLGSDPELRFTPGGVPVAHFDLAVNKEWTDEAGQKQSKTVWTRVTCWRKLAETCSQYLTKGKRVLVVGDLESANAYIDREGNARATNEVTAGRVLFLSAPGVGQPADTPAEGATDEAF